MKRLVAKNLNHAALCNLLLWRRRRHTAAPGRLSGKPGALLPVPLARGYPVCMSDGFWIALCIMADGLDVFSGGGGWAGFGLTGLLLSWILLISIPAKDKQMRVMIERQDAEREKDRVARHELAGKFQDVMTAVMAQHIRDAENDRASFMTRHIRFEDALSKVQEAISRQTLELTKELRTFCKFHGNENKP